MYFDQTSVLIVTEKGDSDSGSGSGDSCGGGVSPGGGPWGGASSAAKAAGAIRHASSTVQVVFIEASGSGGGFALNTIIHEVTKEDQGVLQGGRDADTQ